MNRAAFNLAAWLRTNCITQEEFAKKLGISKSSFNRIIRGRQEPGIGLAFDIERKTDGEIPAKEWAVKGEVRTEIVV